MASASDPTGGDFHSVLEESIELVAQKNLDTAKNKKRAFKGFVTRLIADCHKTRNVIRTSCPKANTLFTDVSPRSITFFFKTSSSLGCITFFSFVRMSAHMSEVGSQAYEVISLLTNLSFRSTKTFLRVFVEICLEDATDSNVDSEST